MKLPKKKTKPLTDPMAYSTLLYGCTKVGKTTFASGAPNALFLATEPGTNALETFDVQINNWADLLTACAEIKKGDHDFKTIVIDTIDNAYEFCMAHVCAEYDMIHPRDEGYGKGWALVNGEFKRVIRALAALPYGLLMISHSTDRTIETRTGEYTKTTPTLSGGASRIVLGLCDFVLFADIVTKGGEKDATEHRIIRTKSAKHYDAGDRTGKLPPVLDLSYNAFTGAFKAAMKGSK